MDRRGFLGAMLCLPAAPLLAKLPARVAMETVEGTAFDFSIPSGTRAIYVTMTGGATFDAGYCLVTYE